MRLRCFAMLAFVLSTPPVTAGVAAQTVPAKGGKFEARQYNDAGGARLLYRLLMPANYDPAGKAAHPLLVFLHGAGERGSDNKAQLIHGKPMMLAVARQYGCFVLVPQCPAAKRWVEVHWGLPKHTMPKEPSEPMRLVLGVIGNLRKEFKIDPQRLYVMGLSMGGYGTWDIIQRRPNMFAAAVPICGGGDAGGAAVMAKIPIWAFHGDKDGAVPVGRSRDMIAAIKAAGGKPRYTEYAGMGHGIWNKAFNDPQMLKWLFSQKRTAGK